MSRTRARKAPIIFLNRPTVFLRRGAFVSQSKICAPALLLEVSAQFEFELTQRFNDCLFDVCGCCGVSFHASVGESLELFDHFVEPAHAGTG